MYATMWVSYHVYSYDLSVAEREAENPEQPSAGSDDEPNASIHQCRSREPRTTRGGDRPRCPRTCAANLSRPARRCSCGVRPHDNVRVQHGEKSLEVTATQGGEERIDSCPLLREIVGAASRW